jgi:hypothetical protein
MSVDAKCYECISGAGLEPILDKRYINSKTPFTLAKEYSKDVLKSFQGDPSVPPSMKEKLGVAMGLSGGRGQASGFIMRMMAENKKKHQGQYKNPSNNDYGSTMKTFAPFDYKRLANAEQNGEGEGEIGASPFIQKHFGSPDAVPFITKAQRGSEEHRVVAGETEAQKAARLQAKSEQLAKLAKDLLETSGVKDKARGKIKGFLKGRVAIKRAKKVLEKKKYIQQRNKESEEREATRKREKEEKAKKMEDERKQQSKARDDIEEANRQKGREFEKELDIKDNELLLPVLKEALDEDKVVVINPPSFYDYEKQLKEHKPLGKHRENAELKFDTGYARGYQAQRNYPMRYVEFSFPEYRDALKKLKADTLKLKEAGEESKSGYKGKMKHDSNMKSSGRSTPWEVKGDELAERLGELGLTKLRPIGFGSFTTYELKPRPNAGFHVSGVPSGTLLSTTAADKQYYSQKMSAFYEKEDVPRMTEFLETIDKAIANTDTDAELNKRTEDQIEKVKDNLSKLGKTGAGRKRR